MPWTDLLLLSVSLSLYPFSICLFPGTKERAFSNCKIIAYAFLFGLVQGVVIEISCLIGTFLRYRVEEQADHWITFILMAAAALILLKKGKVRIEPSESPGHNEIFTDDDAKHTADRRTKIQDLSFSSLPALSGMAAAASIYSFAVGTGISIVHIVYWILPLLAGLFTILSCLAAMYIGRVKANNAIRMGGFACIIEGVALLSIALDILYKHGVF